MDEVLIILGLVLLNGMLSMSEIALISARKSRLEADSKRGSKSAGKALDLINEPDRFLSTIQIGITLIGIVTGLYSGEAFARDLADAIQVLPEFAPYALGISRVILVVSVTYLTLVFGELVPKRLGMNAPERISKTVAAPMFFLARITAPFVWGLTKSTHWVLRFLGTRDDLDSRITEDEIKAIIKEGYDVGEVQEVEHDIMGRVLNLGDRDVSSIMTHRSDVVWLEEKDGFSVVMEKVKGNLFDVYPVCSERFENILGVIYLKDLFGQVDTPEFALTRWIKPAQYLPEHKSVYSALEQIKAAQERYGIVVDEFGEILGIVTLKDIIEALIGDVPEHGEEEDIIEREDGSYLVDGQCSFYNLLEKTDMEHLYSGNEYKTLSGLILDVLKNIPVTGQKFVWRDFEFEIVDMDGARIDRVLVKLRPETDV